jgi:hypothetical protein
MYFFFSNFNWLVKIVQRNYISSIDIYIYMALDDIRSWHIYVGEDYRSTLCLWLALILQEKLSPQTELLKSNQIYTRRKTMIYIYIIYIRYIDQPYVFDQVRTVTKHKM